MNKKAAGCRLEATAMASRYNDQVHLSSSCSCLSDKNHGRSKAQMCLKKILDFISFNSSSKTHEMKIGSGFGNGIDLNITFESNDDVHYGDKDKSPQRVCEFDVQKELSDSKVRVEQQKEEEEEEEEESSEITNVQEMEITQAQAQSEDEERSNKVKNGKRKIIQEQSMGYLDLLVEAARLVSGNLQDDERVKEPSRTGPLEAQTKTVPPQELKADTNCFDSYGGIEMDMSPFVRSKRGRNQVLPNRYRDSVLEPLRKMTYTSKSARLSATKHKSRK